MLTAIQIKLIICVVLAAGIGGGFLYVKSLRDDNKQLTENNRMLEWAASEHERIAKEAKEFELLALSEKEALKRENDTYVSNITSGKYRVYIRASCPATTQATVSGEPGETYAELGGNVRQDILRFRGVLGEVQSDFNDCKRRLRNESAK